MSATLRISVDKITRVVCKKCGTFVDLQNIASLLKHTRCANENRELLVDIYSEE